MIFKLISQIAFILKLIYLSILTIPRDIKGLILRIKISKLMKKWDREKLTVAKQFRSLVEKHPNKACIIFENTTWTFQNMEEYSNKIAHSFSNKYKLRKGDCVALFMENRPEFIAIWLGLSKLGVITALVNTNLKSKALVHSITVAESKVLIYSTELSESLKEVEDQLDKSLSYVIYGDKAGSSNRTTLESLIKNASSEYFLSDEELTINDSMLYIYTSGTTGLPKPAIIRNSRYYGGGFTFIEAAGLTNDDIVYVSLPIYHGNGGLIGVGAGIVRGNTIVLRKKFSASNFWKDCIEHHCTTFIYVGEICRYLVNQPPSPLDRQHSIKVAIGNGMRKNVWEEFDKRFGIKALEFYASSEGNCTIFNLTCRVGCCGFLPPCNPYLGLVPIYIIKVDEETNPIRDENGFCIKCEPGEKGVAIGIIGNKPLEAYGGYANNASASSKKIIENVFKTGQKAFNSGDLMMYDEYGYYYFCDRLGDTYRWKGENVSTVEVENIISSKLDSAEIVVYGVQVPGQEGRAGMAAILKQNIDIDKLSTNLKNDLPSYARPLFIRIANDCEHTGTFRAQKFKLTDVGFDINKIQDKLYYFDQKEQRYLPLTKEIYESILNMDFKL